MVTGAFGFSGRYIAGKLLKRGHRVCTLTNSPHRPDPFNGRVKPFRYNFDRPNALAASLEGVKTLYNTYWIRFNSHGFTLRDAQENTRILFRAARKAGVERIVHISITNAAKNSELEYFRRKGLVEEMLIQSGMSHAILRPAVLFGREDILINNIAWTLRRLPIFIAFGHPSYRLQPIHVDDLAALAVEQGEKRYNTTINAIGPETYTYEELVRTIGRIIGRQRPIVSVPPRLGAIVSWLTGKLMHDVMVTYDEVRGLMAEKLYVDDKPAGDTSLKQWLAEHSETIGRFYESELERRLDRKSMYRAY